MTTQQAIESGDDPIIEQVIAQCGFSKHSYYLKCRHCGKRLLVNSIGKPIEERMQYHAYHYHKIGIEPL